MADRNSRSDRWLSERRSNFRNRRDSGGDRRTSDPAIGPSAVSLNQPRIIIRLDHSDHSFLPGDVLVCEYEIRLPTEMLADAVESSVIWTTGGKGEVDIGVHFFERRSKSTLDADQLRRPHRISTVLPRSPLSYNGLIVQIRWSVRLRVFVSDQQFTNDLHFQLGNAISASGLSQSDD